MKITVIGGGSTYTPELVNGFLARAEKLPLRELWLMDIDAARLEIVGGFAQRMTAAQGQPFKVVLSTRQEEAITGASYVITQLRVGQMPARVTDEYLGRRHGLIGQETTGIGGMAKALRTIPVILGVAAEMRRSAPEAWLLNFTNPAGLVTEALNRHAADVPAVGVCNVGITTRMEILEELAKRSGEPIAEERCVLRTLGLNHLTWHYGLTVDEQDIWQMLFPAFLERLQQEGEAEWDLTMLRELGMMPNYYLQYYYHTERKLRQQEQWPPSRGEEVSAIEKDLLAQYADPALHAPPADLMKRGGAYYSTLATRLIDSHYNDLGYVEVVNVRNNETVPAWPSDWVLEMPCRIDRQGIHPMPARPLPAACAALVEQVKTYELLTIQAAVHGDRDAARQALMAHPLGPRADQLEAVLEDMLNTNRQHLPLFFPKE